MQKTKNYNLNKPDSSDQYNIKHFNDNADTIDKALDDIVKGNTPVQKISPDATMGGEKVVTVDGAVKSLSVKDMPDNTDINTIRDDGIYMVRCLKTPEVFNFPKAGTYILTVNKGIKQNVISQQMIDTNFGFSYERVERAGEWQTWHELATTDGTVKNAEHFIFLESIVDKSLNDVLNNGKYIMRNTSSINDGPEWLKGIYYATLYVLDWAGTDKQQIIIGGNSDGHIAIRFNGGGGDASRWSSWVDYATTDSLVASAIGLKSKETYTEVTPNEIENAGLFLQGYGHGNEMGLPSDLYTVFTAKGWVDSTGDKKTMIAISRDNTIYTRQEITGQEWGQWKKLATTTDISTEFKRRMSFNKDTGELTIDLN